MLQQSTLMHSLMHSYDLIWEYDRTQDRIFVHYDKLLPAYEGKWYAFSELIESFRASPSFRVNNDAWDHRISHGFLKGTPKNDDKQNEFFLSFWKDDICYWYTVLLEAQNKDTLLITGRNILPQINDHALQNSVMQSFELVLCIDPQTKTCLISRENKPTSLQEREQDYEKTIQNFLASHHFEQDREELSELMRLDHVKEMLEREKEYTLFIGVFTQGGALAHKQLTYSYLSVEHHLITLTAIDITSIALRYEQQLHNFRQESYRDALTGVYNRNYYELNLKEVCFTGGVAILDLDNFKLCNDAFGHAAGDSALIAFSKLISELVGISCSLIRFGGDEFLLLAPQMKEALFHTVLEQIRQKTLSLRSELWPTMRLSTSIGAVMVNGETVQSAVAQADALMYHGKKQQNIVITKKTQNAQREKPPKLTILIVDDSALNRDILAQMLLGEFQILTAKNGEECLQMLKQHTSEIHLVLLDIVMPGMDGFDVLTEMNRLHYIDDIPVIVISADDSDTNIRRAFRLGASDYIRRPFDGKIVYRRARNTVMLYARQRRLVSMLTQQSRENERQSRVMIDILSRIIDYKNGENASHVQHMRAIVRILCEKLLTLTDRYHLTYADCSLIATAATLHDVGKICVDSDILNKPGKLTEEEYRAVQQHTILGEQLLRSLSLYTGEPLLRTAMEICRWHHERYDGGGYPDGICAEEIPISAQIVSLADAYDALTTKRTYKEAYPPAEAVQMILDGRCGAFNPILLQCLQQTGQKLAAAVSMHESFALSVEQEENR